MKLCDCGRPALPCGACPDCVVVSSFRTLMASSGPTQVARRHPQGARRVIRALRENAERENRDGASL